MRAPASVPAAAAEGAPASWREAARAAGRRELFLEVDERPLRDWQRDTAIFGGLTALIASASVLVFAGEAPVALYVIGAAVGGALSGVVAGGVFYELCRTSLRRAGLLGAASAFAVFGALWGAASGAVGGFVISVAMKDPGGAMMFVGAIPAALVGAVQSAWFGPAYGMGADRARLLAIGAGVSVLLGWGAVFSIAAVLVYAVDHL